MKRKIERFSTLCLAFMAGCAILVDGGSSQETLIQTDDEAARLIRAIQRQPNGNDDHESPATLELIETALRAHKLAQPMKSSSSSSLSSSSSSPQPSSSSSSSNSGYLAYEQEAAAQSQQQINKQQQARSHHYNHQQRRHYQQQQQQLNPEASLKLKLIEASLSSSSSSSSSSLSTPLSSLLLSTTGLTVSNHNNNNQRRRLIKRSGISDQKLAEMQMIRALKKQSERAASRINLASNLSAASLELAST